MSFKFNPFLSNFDNVGATSSWKAPVANVAALPASGNTDGDVRLTLDLNDAYRWNASGSAWQYVGKVKAAAVGSSPSANGFTIGTDNTITLQPVDATHPGVVTTGAQSIAGIKTFSSVVNSDGGVDRSTSGTLAIGTSSNATTINIGNSGATVNIQGTTIYENTTQLQVADPLITLNKGGGAGSASASGIELEENAILTGYVKTSGDRNSWTLKAPNTAGVATVTAGAGGITLDQSSHNPVTLGAVGASPNANAASLSTQVLTLQPADGTNPGVLTSGAQSIGGAKTFTGAISASNLSGTNTGDQTITLTGDVTGSGTGSFATTVAKIQSTTVSGTTGTTNVVFSNSPSLVTPNLGTPTTLVGTNITGTAGALNIGGTAQVATTATITDSSTNALFYPTFVNSSFGGALGLKSSGNYSYNPFTNTLTAINITGTTSGNLVKSAGDINEKTFSAANNQVAAANVTGFSFANGTVRAFEALVSVYINASANLYEVFTLRGIQKDSSWDMSQTSNGDASGFVFSITTAGQIKYTSPNSSGFIATTVQFRAISTSV